MDKKVDVLIFHYPCADGIASAWVITYYCVLHRIDIPELYGTVPGLDQYDFPDTTGKSVFIADLCFDKNIMKTLEENSSQLVVFDHHRSSFPQAVESTHTFIFDLTRSGCQITWDYFFPNHPRPLFINYIADRDLWLWKVPLSKEFTTELFYRTRNSSVREYLQLLYDISKFDKNQYCDFIEDGKYLMKMCDIQVELECEKAVKCTLKCPDNSEYTVWTFCNRMYVSEIGSKLSERGDVALCYTYDIKEHKWIISLRSGENHDVSFIAQKFPHGGGHARAAGFEWKDDLRIIL